MKAQADRQLKQDEALGLRVDCLEVFEELGVVLADVIPHLVALAEHVLDLAVLERADVVQHIQENTD